jgi:glycosyltransferase involved in cell wall biosynthesis
MSCGKPVLATKCGGPNEFVTNETGILIEPDNDEELKSKFIYMLHHHKGFDPTYIISYARNLFSKEKASIAFQEVYSTIQKSIKGQRK